MITGVCPRCRRTVVFALIDGAKVALDPEITSVVAASGKALAPTGARIHARRVHGELCASYAAAARKPARQR